MASPPTARPTLNLGPYPVAAPAPPVVADTRGCAGLDEILNWPAADVAYLGRGSYGSVFRLGTEYTIKRVRFPNPAVKGVFAKEAAIWNELAGIPELLPYMPQFCWSLVTSGEGLVVMRYEDTVTLKDVMMGPKIPEDVGMRIAQGLFDALRMFNSMGYVHRDVSPTNILIRRSGPLQYTPILIDFGFVCKYPCMDLERVGTAEFMPPNWLPLNQRTRRGFLRESTVRPVNYKGNTTAEREAAAATGARFIQMKEQTDVLMPKYGPASDAYALSKVLQKLGQRMDVTTQETYDTLKDMILKLRYGVIPQLAAELAATKARGVRLAARPPFVPPSSGSFFRAPPPPTAGRTRRRNSNTNNKTTKRARPNESH